MGTLKQKLSKTGYVNIPVELCEYAIRNNFYRPMQLYIYLNANCSGKLKISNDELPNIGKAIGLNSARAVKNNLNILMDKNWIGYNKKSKIYFIRGVDKIRWLHGFKTKTAAEFDSREIKKLKAFLAAAKIGYLLDNQKRKKRATERLTGRSNHVARQSFEYYPLANLALAKVLNVSLSTAYQLKQLAHKAGYIAIKKSFVETNLDAYQETPLKKGLPELASKVRIKKGKILLQGIDMVMHFLTFKKRKKLET